MIKRLAYRFRHWLLGDLKQTIVDQTDRIIAQAAFDGSDDKVFKIHYRGQEVKFFLPNANIDSIQKKIVVRGEFYEADILEELLRDLPEDAFGKTIVDIGANIGNHTLFFAIACRAGHVVSFEPNAYAANILRKNCSLNHLDKVIVHEVAVSSKRETLDFDIHHGRNLGGTRFKQSEAGRIRSAPLQAFDIPTPVSLIKIDVEGMAVAVLEGARTIIEDQKPLVFCEAFEDELGEVQRIMKDLGYKILKTYRDDNYLFGPA